MSIFLRRHPAAPPKIKGYVRRFEKIANEFQAGNMSYTQDTKKLNDKFYQLTYGLKHTLISRSSIGRRPRERQFPEPRAISTFLTSHISKPSTTKSKISKPKVCTVISKALPTHPAYGAYRFYDSIATQEMKLDEEELQTEIEDYPHLQNDYNELSIKKKVDPFLHIGGFARCELLRSPDERFANTPKTVIAESAALPHDNANVVLENEWGSDFEKNNVKSENEFDEEDEIEDEDEIDEEDELDEEDDSEEDDSEEEDKDYEEKENWIRVGC